MIIRIVLWILIGIIFTQAQVSLPIEKRKTRYGFKVDREPAITYQLFVHRTWNWKPILLVAVSIQNDKLQFEKNDAHYESRFRITVAVRHDKKLVTQNTWDERADVDNFKETNSRSKYQYRMYRLPVFNRDWEGPHLGEFQFYLEIRDLVSNQINRFKKKFIISKDMDPASTEIAFLRRPCKGDTIQLTGSGEILKFNHPAWAFLRAKNSKTNMLTFNARIYYNDDEVGDKLIFQKFFDVKGDSGIFTLCFPMPYDSLDEGKYLLRITNKKWKKERKFRVVWFAKPTYLYKYDLAIRPMQYLLDEKTYKRVKHLSYNKLKKWFKAYWKKRDPTPNTVYNELMVEFFRRVAEANKKFSTRHREGWETDQGRIYILYGKPTKIDDHRYATETRPYQIWVYGDSLQFLFVDKNGNGEFSLVTVKK
ncbi:hypothetical protein DRI50_07220 [candidate division KSB1 bacterium]|nr:MAG: hypothetical protein DRI50_07220 [candidate division KSB1 bacterium]